MPSQNIATAISLIMTSNYFYAELQRQQDRCSRMNRQGNAAESNGAQLIAVPLPVSPSVPTTRNRPASRTPLIAMELEVVSSDMVCQTL